MQPLNKGNTKDDIKRRSRKYQKGGREGKGKKVFVLQKKGGVAYILCKKQVKETKTNLKNYIIFSKEKNCLQGILRKTTKTKRPDL